MSEQLLDALLTGSITEVQQLLTQGADVNQIYEDYSSNSLLHMAVIHGNTEVTELILDKGGAVNHKNTLNQIPLHHAVSSSNVEITKLLLKHNADCFVRDIFGNTPLFYAVAEDMFGGIANYTEERAEIISLLSPDIHNTTGNQSSKNTLTSIAENMLSISSNTKSSDSIVSAYNNYIYACALADVVKETKRP